MGMDLPRKKPQATIFQKEDLCVLTWSCYGHVQTLVTAMQILYVRLTGE